MVVFWAKNENGISSPIFVSLRCSPETNISSEQPLLQRVYHHHTSIYPIDTSTLLTISSISTLFQFISLLSILSDSCAICAHPSSPVSSTGSNLRVPRPSAVSTLIIPSPSFRCFKLHLSGHPCFHPALCQFNIEPSRASVFGPFHNRTGVGPSITLRCPASRNVPIVVKSSPEKAVWTLLKGLVRWGADTRTTCDHDQGFYSSRCLQLHQVRQ